MNIAKALRSRRERARSNRAITRAMSGASPAFRDELIHIAQRSGTPVPRI